MKLRLIVAPLFLALVLLCAASPVAVAQPVPKLEITAKWASDHPAHQLKKDGRDNMGVTVIAKGQDFTCLQPFEFSVVIVFEGAFENWAGSSMENALVTFQFDAQQPGNAPGKEIKKEGQTRLNFAWDVEGAPKQGAEQVYVVKPTEYKKSQTKNGPCVQEPTTATLTKSAEMKVTLPDRLDANSTESEPCDQNPDQEKCKSAVPQAADSPAPGVLVLLGAVGMVAYLRRKQV